MTHLIATTLAALALAPSTNCVPTDQPCLTDETVQAIIAAIEKANRQMLIIPAATRATVKLRPF